MHASLELKVPPVAVVVAVGCLMWGLARVGPVYSGSSVVRPVLAAVLLLAGLVIAVAGVAHFRQARTTVNPLRPEQASAIVTTGIYARSRNPMYLGMLLVLAAWAAWLGSALALLGLPSFVAYMNRWQILPEERVLAARFPHEFARYARAVRRWA